MDILIIHAHWNNRGDEAALRALIDSTIDKHPDARIKVLLHTGKILQFPYRDNIIAETPAYPRKRDLYFESIPFLLSGGRICLSQRSKHFKQLVQEANLVIHGPGGPSIGEIYKNSERFYLYRLLAIKALKKPYMFYAPSMGPFGSKNSITNAIRRKVIDGAAAVCLREPISAEYVKALGCKAEPIVTLDSAFQYPVRENENADKLKAYRGLNSFLNTRHKVVGITITDLMWNPKYRGDVELETNIRETFQKMLAYLENEGYGILFIPQLFGEASDRNYMSSFKTENSFVMDDTHDCYFQQYIISKMYAVIGMRYHSNIFAAKMATPFISISYEQKMSGFMKKAGLSDYCVQIRDLNMNILKETFEKLCGNYDAYSACLKEKSIEWRREASKTTEIVEGILEKM